MASVPFSTPDRARRAGRWSCLCLAAAIGMLAGCMPDVGACDEAAAHEVVFLDTGVPASDANGMPMFAGQAIVFSSCGGDAFCHSENATGTQRYGVPHGLDFDVDRACEDAPCFLPQTGAEALLSHGIDVSLAHARDILRTLDQHAMPPGRIGRAVARTFGRYVRVAASDFAAVTAGTLPLATAESPLPEADSHEGRELVRNWLACGAPAIERAETDAQATPGADCAHIRAGTIGPCVNRLVVPAVPPEPVWSSIYSDYLVPACVSCHGPGPTDARGLSRLDLSSEALAYDSLVGAPSSGVSCAGVGTRVVPGDPNASLLLGKLRVPSTCGLPMPGARGAPAAVQAAIRTWIAAGAAP